MAQEISAEIMEYMVWVVEIAAREFFCGDKSAAYSALQNSGAWDAYVENYDVTHTLGKEYILNELREIFTMKGLIR